MPGFAQQEFSYRADAPDPLPDLSHDGAAWLVAHLLRHPDGPGRHGGWTAAHLCEAAEIPPSASNKRRIRSWAEAAGPAVVSAPAVPYKHRSHCTAEEIATAVAAKRSQGRTMLRDRILLARAAHRDLDPSRN